MGVKNKIKTSKTKAGAETSTTSSNPRLAKGVTRQDTIMQIFKSSAQYDINVQAMTLLLVKNLQRPENLNQFKRIEFYKTDPYGYGFKTPFHSYNFEDKEREKCWNICELQVKQLELDQSPWGRKEAAEALAYAIWERLPKRSNHLETEEKRSIFNNPYYKFLAKVSSNGGSKDPPKSLTKNSPNEESKKLTNTVSNNGIDLEKLKLIFKSGEAVEFNYKTGEDLFIEKPLKENENFDINLDDENSLSETNSLNSSQTSVTGKASNKLNQSTMSTPNITINGADVDDKTTESKPKSGKFLKKFRKNKDKEKSLSTNLDKKKSSSTFSLLNPFKAGKKSKSQVDLSKSVGCLSADKE